MRCPCALQLMSELVRKAEADIDVLRTRLAAVDVPPLSSAAAQSDALLQVPMPSSCCAVSTLLLHSDSNNIQ